MTKTEELRAALRALLVESCPSVQYAQNLLDDDDAPRYPYCVFSARETGRDDDTTAGELEVNVVDLGPDTAQAERIADEIARRLDRYVYLGEAVAFWLYAGIRQPVQDENKRLVRRRLTFELRLMERR